MFKRSFWASPRGKAGIGLASLSLAAKLCGTCIFWGGSRKAKPDGYVQVHPYSKGDCRDGTFNHASMAALATCDKWQPWLQVISD